MEVKLQSETDGGVELDEKTGLLWACAETWSNN